MAADTGKLPHEIFVGNTLRDGPRFRWLVDKGLKTARLGDVALDIDGKPLPHIYAPIFIDRGESDKHNAITMEQAFGPHWRRG